MNAPTVQRWLESSPRPPDVQQRQLQILEAFCERVGKTPDELVAFCFLRKKDTASASSA